jgi:hypothetical protein
MEDLSFLQQRQGWPELTLREMRHCQEVAQLSNDFACLPNFAMLHAIKALPQYETSFHALEGSHVRALALQLARVLVRLLDCCKCICTSFIIAHFARCDSLGRKAARGSATGKERCGSDLGKISKRPPQKCACGVDPNESAKAS